MFCHRPYAILLKAVKIGEKNFGELLVIHQIRQKFFTTNILYRMVYRLISVHMSIL